MKIPHSIYQKYSELYEQFSSLDPIVSGIIKRDILNEAWLFRKRLKEAESFYIKLQTGRVEAAYEDIFACTIVVENLSQVQEAEKAVLTFFDSVSRKPPEDCKTVKKPEVFCFDDLRLYLKLKERDCLSPELKNLVFELQVKTFLQYAWGIATHDLIYKPVEGADWAMARVAFQIKAMLEHAEISINQAQELSASPHLAKETNHIQSLKQIEAFISIHWETPIHGINRLAENLYRLCSIFEVPLDDMIKWVSVETTAGRGAMLTRFSPYEVVLGAILKYKPDAIRLYQRKNRNGRNTIVIPDEFLDFNSSCGDIFCRISQCGNSLNGGASQ